MMLDFAKIVKDYNLKITGIIQLGAHLWQEKNTFLALGINNFVLVEPQKLIFEKLKAIAKGTNSILYNVAVTDEEEGFSTMFCDTVNEGQSASLLQAKKHKEKYPQIVFNRLECVELKRIENLKFDRTKYNCLVMDLQGYEIHALRGSGDLLCDIDYIYTEVNFIEMYEGCAMIDELDEYLFDSGFQRVLTGENYNNQGWSDAFYMKK